MRHVCHQEKLQELKCRYSWGWGSSPVWCEKVMCCPDCGERVNPYLECIDSKNCQYFKPRKWYNFNFMNGMLRSLGYLKWHISYD